MNACLLAAIAALGTDLPAKLPITGLSPAVLVANLSPYGYRVTTASSDCQRFCDQALAYHYSYVYMEAARSFETALASDPNCAFAWLGLHKALEKWGKTAIPKSEPLMALLGGSVKDRLPLRYTKAPKDYALEMARSLQKRCGHRESLLIQARLQEKGFIATIKEDERKKQATATLDELLTLYEDDQEGWFARAQIAEGKHGSAPFYKALLKLNPIHPGASHELVHFYENIQRPALGWPYAEKYMASSPGLPHAFHMQAHLAMRIGKWQQTTDWSQRAIQLEEDYHRIQGVKPADDHQYQHHLETLTRSLVHDGRHAEAKAIQATALANKYYFRPEWVRMAIVESNWTAATTLINEFKKGDKAQAAYHAAHVALAQNDLPRARAEIDILRQAKPSKKDEKRNEARIWEVQGLLNCYSGDGDAGLKLLKRAVDKTKNDYAHHSWGNGATLMESWGKGALAVGHWEDAEEAFQEALAHDSGSVRGALGLWIIYTRTDRPDAAARSLALARKCWQRADAGLIEQLQSSMQARVMTVAATQSQFEAAKEK
jgi:tetratricopeptide (TPR) repeat protein